MDLSVSPDIEAYFCYAIVLLLGAATAVVQINRGLGDLAGVWLIPRTWLLFFMYLIVPIGLFWFLDRTGAISDTSLFAAALIGVGYERIMNGSNQNFPSTANLLQFWTPFQAYANDVQKSVLQRTKRNEDRLVDSLVSSITADNTRYAPLENLAIRFSPDVPALRAKLAAINAGAPAAATPAAAAAQQKEILEDKTRLLFTELVKVPDAFYLMKSRNIISKPVYLLDVKGMRRVFRYGAVLVLLIIALVVVWPLVKPQFKNLRSDYYIWRLVKTNATGIEQNRARSNLLKLMHDNVATKDVATRNIAQLLRQPGLPVERIDLLLQSLLESRDAPDGNAGLPMQLVASLRSASVDARTRINDVLKHLAESACSTKFSEEKDKVWKPSDGDATVSLETRIKAWTEYWNNACNKKTT